MKSIQMNLRWIVWLLVGMGALFLMIGIVAYRLATGFDSMADERIFRYTFLGVFGGVGAIQIIAGAVVGFRQRSKQAAIDDLVSSGNSVWAEVVDVSSSQNARINNQSPRFLRCVYKHTDGNTYMFRSPYLRYDPRALLKDGKVKVWFDPYNMERYYVDVDGSLTENVIEL